MCVSHVATAHLLFRLLLLFHEIDVSTQVGDLFSQFRRTTFEVCLLRAVSSLSRLQSDQLFLMTPRVSASTNQSGIFECDLELEMFLAKNGSLGLLQKNCGGHRRKVPHTLLRQKVAEIRHLVGNSQDSIKTLTTRT